MAEGDDTASKTEEATPRRLEEARKDGDVCALADDPAHFAERVLALFRDPQATAAMARRARAEVETNWDMAAITGRLVESYRALLAQKSTRA